MIELAISISCDSQEKLEVHFRITPVSLAATAVVSIEPDKSPVDLSSLPNRKLPQAWEALINRRFQRVR